MSSTMKDARWQLAHDMLRNTSKAESLSEMPYAVQEHVLSSAQSVLEHLPATDVAKLAKLFGSGAATAPPVQVLPRKYVNMERLEELQRLNQSGADGTYIISQLELDEILDLAMDGWEGRAGAEKLGEKKILKALARLIKEEM